MNKVVLGLKTKLKQIGSEFGMGCKTFRYDHSCSSGRLSKNKVNKTKKQAEKGFGKVYFLTNIGVAFSISVF